MFNAHVHKYLGGWKTLSLRCIFMLQLHFFPGVIILFSIGIHILFS